MQQDALPARDAKADGKAQMGERLAKLRALMKERNVDIYVVPSEDSHASEYIASCDARREYISGFTGSAGCTVITQEKAILATDGRYFNQATKELSSDWELLKQGTQDVPTWQEWSASEAAGGKTVAVDPALISAPAAKKLTERIQKAGGADLVPLKENLVDLCWHSDRPPVPRNPVVPLAHEFAGKDVKAKLTELRQELTKKNSSGFIVSMLDEIAWLFNIRGSDIPYNPVFFSYAVVTAESAVLYIDKSRLGEETVKHLEDNDVVIKPYDQVLGDAQELGAGSLSPGSPGKGQATAVSRPLISTKASWALKLALGGEGKVEEMRSPIGDAKAVKNPTEMEGMRACHVRDGAALIEFFAWLEDQLVVKKSVLDEVAAADKLEEIRRRQKYFVGLSFPTISSTGANAAVIHYGPKRGECAVINADAVYLCDSGAQYLDGTTDTTRTVHFGTPTDFEKQAYTLVLKGNMALDMAVFPKGTTGFALDGLARQYLWVREQTGGASKTYVVRSWQAETDIEPQKEGLDYRHGTGHGVGSYLNVHEGPIGIGTRVQYAEVALAPGNVVSIEPGFYEDGSFGIRIENIAMVKEVQTKHSFGDKPYLGFEHVTMVPFCRNLIDVNLLTAQEKAWLNQYNADILKKTRHLFDKDALTAAWLDRETQAF